MGGSGITFPTVNPRKPTQMRLHLDVMVYPHMLLLLSFFHNEQAQGRDFELFLGSLAKGWALVSKRKQIAQPSR